MTESIPEGEWVEGERKEGETIEDAHLYRIVVDADHRVTAHFKATAATPAAEESNGAAGDKAKTAAKTTVKTGDGAAASAVAAAAIAAAAGAGALKAAKETAATGE